MLARGRACPLGLVALLLTLPAVLSGCLESVEAPRELLPDTALMSLEPVTVEGNELLVGGEPFLVKGVVYSPVPPGVDPNGEDIGYDWVNDPDIWERDLPLLKEMGANTLRIVNTSLDPAAMNPFLDLAARLHIKVILGISGPTGEDASDPEVRERTLREVRRLVVTYREHPAVLMWLVGNEVNYWYPEDGDVRDWFTLLEEAAQEAKDLDSDHPVATANNALRDLRLFLELSPSVDVYGMNQYAPDSSEYDVLFTKFAKEAPRTPLLITEFGADAWDSSAGTEHEDLQARIVADNWRRMEAHADGPFVGACLFEWSDEWWKGGDAEEQRPDASWAPAHAEGVLPDGLFSEAYFGVARVTSVGGDLELRKAFFAMQELWRAGEEPSPPAVVAVRSETNGDTVRLEAEVYAYGGVPVDVNVRYRVKSGAWQRAPMEPTEDPHRWVTEIGPFDGLAVVFYRVHAVDDAGRASRTAEGTVHAVPGPGAVATLGALVAVAAAAAAWGRRGREQRDGHADRKGDDGQDRREGRGGRRGDR